MELMEITQDGLSKWDERNHVLELSRSSGADRNYYLKQFVTVRRLLLAQCALPYIPKEIFELKQLDQLDLSGNEFSSGIKPTIGKLKRLKALNLANCKLKAVPTSIADLEQLEELNLSGNRCSRGVSHVGELRKLKILKLSNSALKALPDSIGDLEQLEVLDVSGNSFSSGINLAVGRLKHLKTLNLSNSALTALPEFVGGLQKLNVLDLSGNKFSTDISSVVGRLQLLRALKIANSGLKSFPDCFGELQMLEDLDLSGNAFRRGISPVIGRLMHLRVLKLASSELTTLPNSIEDLEKLEELDVADNNFGNGLTLAIGRLFKLKKLLLHQCALSSLPNGMEDLIQLNELSLSLNRLPDGLNPASIQLQKLRLGGCGLRIVPERIHYLELLQELDMRHSNLANQLQPVTQLKQLTKLNVSACHLNSLPDSLINLKKLEALILSHNTFSDGLNPTLGQLENLKKLYLMNCKLTAIPEWFGHLHGLEMLDLRDNVLHDSTKAVLGRLPCIRELNRCRFDEIKLSDLLKNKTQELKLSHYNFADGLNPVLGRLTGLNKLVLIDCELTQLPDWLEELTLLEELNLSKNNFFTGLSKAVGRLRKLKRLHLGQCFLSKLPDWIDQLGELQELDLSHNNFSDGINPAIGNLHRLAKLDLCQCGLSTLPTSFGDMEQLAYLTLKDNKIEVYPKCTLHLKSLRRLDISREQLSSDEYNGIANLPVELAESQLSELILEGNPITEPPKEIWRQGLEAIKSYFKEERHGLTEVRPDTINMIGDVCAGKTSIAQSLQKLSPQPAERGKRTHVLDQLEVKFGQNGEWLVTINDFGGHQIYHSVTSIFLPTDGLVILAYDLSKDFEEQSRAVRRWLITVIAKSEEIRVIVVGTHADEVPKQKKHTLQMKMETFTRTVLEEAKREAMHHKTTLKSTACQDQEVTTMVERKLKQQEALLKRLNGAQVSVVALSCSIRNRGLKKLHNRVSSMLRAPTNMPRRWFAIMRDIKNATSDCAYLKWKQVQDIYKTHVKDGKGDKDLRIILRYLASTSQIIWLEKHETLCEVVFNSPRKIISVCKQVLDHTRARAAKDKGHTPGSWSEMYANDVERYALGVVRQPFMKVLLSTNDEQADIAVGFLKNFNLISEIKPEQNDKIFVIPSILPKKEPVEKLNHFNTKLSSCDDSLAMELSFVGSVIPKSFFEASVSSMLTAAYELDKHETSTEPWQDGLLILYKEVSFSAVRKENKVILTAFSDKGSDMSPWIILRPVFVQLHRYITGIWHGALPECHVLCPSCRRKSSSTKPGKFEVPFEILSCVSLTERYNRKCKECFETNPSLLCLQISKGQKRSLESNIDESSREAPAKRERKSNDELSEYVKRLRSATPLLIRELETSSVKSIVDELQAANDGCGCLTDGQVQDIEAERTCSERTRKLLRIVSQRGDETIKILAMALRSDGVGRPDLAKRIEPLIAQS